MKNNIIFRMVAYTDAAGKYDPAAPRMGNEDNFFVSYDLSKKDCNNSDTENELSDCGMLMVVADGMGGMNDGEVASEIAIKTVKEFFTPQYITPKIASDCKERKHFMEQVIIEADKRIKKDASENEEHYGMGSTIIMAWIVGEEMTISWCGDSRAYRFNPTTGIELLSCDHSYVQELANKGVITYEDTFDHPQNNIITRSLGDNRKKAHPETKDFHIYKDDIILLCSDGLNGVLRDKKTYYSDGELIPGYNIEDIIKENQNNLTKCREALWQAAENSDWYDNVTTILCKIISAPHTMTATPNTPQTPKLSRNKKRILKNILITFVILLLVLCCSYYIYSKNNKNNNDNNKTTAQQPIENVNTNTCNNDGTSEEKTNSNTNDTIPDSERESLKNDLEKSEEDFNEGKKTIKTSKAKKAQIKKLKKDLNKAKSMHDFEHIKDELNLLNEKSHFLSESETLERDFRNLSKNHEENEMRILKESILNAKNMNNKNKWQEKIDEYIEKRNAYKNQKNLSDTTLQEVRCQIIAIKNKL